MTGMLLAVVKIVASRININSETQLIQFTNRNDTLKDSSSYPRQNTRIEMCRITRISNASLKWVVYVGELFSVQKDCRRFSQQYSYIDFIDSSGFNHIIFAHNIVALRN